MSSLKRKFPYRGSSKAMPQTSSSHLFEGTLLKESDFGTETEAEKQMKLLLEKQLKTDLPLESYMKDQRQFVNSSSYVQITELIQGTASLEKYKRVEREEEKLQELQRCGLTKEEIEFYLTHKEDGPRDNKRTFTVEPSAISERLRMLKEKIKAHDKELQKPEAFSSVKILTRHEMDLEKTLYQGCDEKKKLDHLIRPSNDNILSDNDPFKHVKTISEKLSQKVQNLRKKKKKLKDEKDYVETSSEDLVGFCYNPSIHHVIVPLEEETVTARRLSIEEIRKIPRFENYEPGLPNKVLYLKNLNPKITIKELQLLFGGFGAESAEGIDYRILSGKMKGQAFVTFPDTASAEKALQYANGYLLREKPIIIQYGKKKT